MEKHYMLAADAFRFVVVIAFVTMTMAFAILPYALSAHPGDPVPPVAAAVPRHLT